MLTISKQEKRKLNKWDLLKYNINWKEYSMIIDSKEYKNSICKLWFRDKEVIKEYLIGRCSESNRKRKVELDQFSNMSDSCLMF